MSGGENIALGAQDFDIADRAVAIERSGALQGDIQRGEIALLRGNLIGQALAQGQRVGHLFKGGLDFLFIVDHLLLLADLRQIEAGLVAPGVENRQFDFGNEVPHRAAGVKQAGEFAAAAGERAGQGDRREEGRPRGADVGVGRLQAVFGFQNIWPLQEDR